jgi:mono/diheme cytochrome c family protein
VQDFSVNVRRQIAVLATVSSLLIFPACFLDFKDVKPLPPSNDTPAQPGDPKLAYGTLRADVLTHNCETCHSPNGEYPDLDFTDYKSLVSNGVIVPGNADQSRLYTKVAAGEMPPSDSGQAPLTTAQIQEIRDWINEGASADGVPKPETESLND